MKKLLKSKMTIVLLVLWVVLSFIGYIGKDTIYRNYAIDLYKTPYFVLVFEGAHDGIYPWSKMSASTWETWENLAQKEENRADLSVADTEDTQQVEVEETETKPVKRDFVKVEKDYFSDAVFIGDSRTVGLHDYGGLDSATFYATVGMNIYNLWTEKFCEVDGELVTLEDALRAQKFGKIYFQIGINEMGRGTVDGFIEAYAQAVEHFKELQPEAVIFVQGIMKVAKEKSDTDPIFNNQGIQERNERIAAFADNISVFYIDMNEVVCDEEGYLKESLTFDDVHLLGSKYGSWVDYLMEKGIE